MPHPTCKHCNMRQPLVVRDRCASCGKLLSEPVRKPTQQDRDLFDQYLAKQQQDRRHIQ